MIKKIENNKVLLISHIADIDGMGSLILANKFYNNNVDYVLCESKDLSELFTSIDFNNYEVIYLCDLSIKSSLIDYLNNHKEIPDKLKHFDHHLSYSDERPNYINSIVSLNGRKTCGTELFYNYLISLDNNFKNNFFDIFVEATREQDTFEFGNQEYYAKLLAFIHSLVGAYSYINLIDSIYNKDDFIIPDVYKTLYEDDLVKQRNYIDNINNNLLITNYKNYVIGVTVSEQYRSIVGNEICKLRPEIDFILIINYSRNSVSLRCVKDTVDLNVISGEFHPNGGGHKKAAGFCLDDYSIPKIKVYNDMYLENLKIINKSLKK